MSIRSAYIIDDIQRVMYELLSYLVDNTSPWTSWDVQYGYPEADVFEHLTKPIIYVEIPTKIDKYGHQGGLQGTVWEMRIGAWDDRVTGGTEEINIISSHILDFFRDIKSCHSTTTFNVTLGSTAYNSTNLQTMGIKVKDIAGPRELFTEDIKEFRHEFTLILET